jgi:hypothetical protein
VCLQHFTIVGTPAGLSSIADACAVMVQCGNIIGANLYRDDDKPLYKRGNRNLIIINLLAIALFLFAKAYYVMKNKIRDRKWASMTPEVSSIHHYCLWT